MKSIWTCGGNGKKYFQCIVTTYYFWCTQLIKETLSTGYTNCESDCMSYIMQAGRSNDPEISLELPMLQPILWVPPRNGYAGRGPIFANSSKYRILKSDFAVLQDRTEIVMTTQAFCWCFTATVGWYIPHFPHHKTRFIFTYIHTAYYRMLNCYISRPLNQ
jgi:hypothetical protein